MHTQRYLRSKKRENKQNNMWAHIIKYFPFFEFVFLNFILNILAVNLDIIIFPKYKYIYNFNNTSIAINKLTESILLNSF